jgi:hypothetical protein
MRLRLPNAETLKLACWIDLWIVSSREAHALRYAQKNRRQSLATMPCLTFICSIRAFRTQVCTAGAISVSGVCSHVDMCATVRADQEISTTRISTTSHMRINLVESSSPCSVMELTVFTINSSPPDPVHYSWPPTAPRRQVVHAQATRAALTPSPPHSKSRR